MTEETERPKMKSFEELRKEVSNMQTSGKMKKPSELRKQVRQMPSPLYPEGRPEDDDTTQT